MADADSTPPADDPEGGGRRQEERRQSQVPFEGPDRRKSDRRSGADRRTTPRKDTGG